MCTVVDKYINKDNYAKYVNSYLINEIHIRDLFSCDEKKIYVGKAVHVQL